MLNFICRLFRRTIASPGFLRNEKRSLPNMINARWRNLSYNKRAKQLYLKNIARSGLIVYCEFDDAMLNCWTACVNKFRLYCNETRAAEGIPEDFNIARVSFVSVGKVNELYDVIYGMEWNLIAIFTFSFTENNLV